jgi:hypothetical protein
VEACGFSPRKSNQQGRPLGLSSSTAAGTPNTAVHITIVILTLSTARGKDLLFVSSRAKGAPSFEDHKKGAPYLSGRSPPDRDPQRQVFVAGVEMWEDQSRRQNCQPPTKVIYRENVILTLSTEKGKDLRFAQSRAEGASTPVEACGFSPTKNQTNKEALRPELFHVRRGTKYRRSHNNCHPDPEHCEGEGSAVCFKPRQRRTRIKVEAQGFSPTKIKPTRRPSGLSSSTAAGAPNAVHITIVILSAAKDLLFVSSRAKGAPGFGDHKKEWPISKRTQSARPGYPATGLRRWGGDVGGSKASAELPASN